MRHRFDRSFYIPKAKGAIKITPKGIEAEIYIYDVNGVPYAAMFGGKRAKPDSHYRYRTVQQREEAVRNYIAALISSSARKQQMRDERNNFQHSLKVGDLLHYSWGYDQTQCEFFQVVKVNASSVVIREIASKTEENSEGRDCDRRLPVRDKFVGEEMLKRVQIGNRVPMKFGSASPTDEKTSHYCSWYC